MTVTGNMSLQGQIDASSDVVAGGISLEIPGAQCDAILRSVSGRLLTDGVSIVDGAPSVRVTTASGNLTIRRISPEKLTENE